MHPGILAVKNVQPSGESNSCDAVRAVLGQGKQVGVVLRGCESMGTSSIDHELASKLAGQNDGTYADLTGTHTRR